MAGNYKILCTICARGGSKGVKNKNIKPLLGKPLIAYTIELALKWKKAKRIVISTDSKKIARAAKSCGAQVPFLRPSFLAKDNSPKLLAVRHALINSEKIFKEKYDFVIDLDPTAPLRSIRDLNRALNIFLKYRPKTLVSAVNSHKNPYFNVLELKSDGTAALCKKFKKDFMRRQDAPKVYDMNASIYLYRRDFLLNTKSLSPITDNTRICLMDDCTGFDIDRDIDFKFTEFLLRGGIIKP